MPASGTGARILAARHLAYPAERSSTSMDNVFRDSKLGAALRHLRSGYHRVNLA